MTRKFGGFEANLATGELRKHGTPVRLQEQPAKILAALLERPGEVVSREDLVRLLWPDGTFVDYDRGLNAAVNRLRQALSDSAESPRYVETVARRGYRFIAPVEAAEGALESPPQAGLPAPRRWLAAAAGMLALAGGTWLLLSKREPPTLPLEPVPLTSYEGIEREPTFSPDATQVAFSWNGPKQDNFDIYVKTVGSDPPARLTTSAAQDRRPAWSPDGRYIAFHRVGEGIFLIAPTGGHERKLAVSKATDQLSWSPDSRRLAYAEAPRGLLPGGISLIDVTTGVSTRVVAAGSDGSTNLAPAISPDGGTLAWTHCPAYQSCRLGFMSLEEERRSPTRYLPSGSGVIQEIVWTADGNRLVYSESVYGVSLRLWEVPVNGAGRPRPLSFASQATASPAISALRRRMAFSQGLADTDIWTMANGALTRSPMSSTFTESHPRFSPDGRRVAFSSTRSGAAEIWVANADGSNPVPLTTSRASGSPRWSPDSRRIIYDTLTREGNWDIAVMDAGGSQPTPVVTDPSDDAVPSFSRDGKWIYFTSNRSGRHEIYRLPVAGGEPVRLTTGGGWRALESPDGKSIYYTKANVACGIPLFVLAIGGNSERQVIDSVCACGFEVTGRGIYYIDGMEADGFLRARLFDPVAGTTREIGQAKGPLYGQFVMGISPDEKTILVAASVQAGTDLYLVENFQ